nr:MAG TPA: hypothetical protein [Caudoviricetes sp.]
MKAPEAHRVIKAMMPRRGQDYFSPRLWGFFIWEEM